MRSAPTGQRAAGDKAGGVPGGDASNALATARWTAKRASRWAAGNAGGVAGGDALGAPVLEATLDDPRMFGTADEWDADRSRFHTFMRDRVF